MCAHTRKCYTTLVKFDQFHMHVSDNPVPMDKKRAAAGQFTKFRAGRALRTISLDSMEHK